MFSAAKAMSNSTSLSTDEGASCVSSGTRVQDFSGLFNNNPPINILSNFNTNNHHHDLLDHHQQPQKTKKKRSLPGNPDPDAEVIALSPKTLLATNRFVCEICNKGFQRDQNLQLHRRGHNLPWKLKQRNSKDQIKKRAYVCPEPTCVHHHPSRALGDLTGIKKHFCRKHGEKKWKCEKCSKIYAVQSDWKAHSKTCGTREYRCDCGTLFSRKDSFITHRAFCDALAEESARLSNQTSNSSLIVIQPLFPNFRSHHPIPSHHMISSEPPEIITPSNNHIGLSPWDPPQPPHPQNPNPSPSHNPKPIMVKPEDADHHQDRRRRHLAGHFQLPPAIIPRGIAGFQGHSSAAASAHLSATALLQKAATVGAQQAQAPGSAAGLAGTAHHVLSTWHKGSDRLTRDFLGLTAADHNHHGSYHHNCGGGGEVGVSVSVKEVLGYGGGGGAAEFAGLKQTPGFGFAEAEAWADC